MSTFDYEIDQADLDRIYKAFDDLGKNARMGIKNAVNRSATKSRREYIARMRKGYTYKKLKLSELRLKTASPATLTAEIIASGRPHALISFRHTFPKSGAKADVVRSGLKLVHGKGSKGFLRKGHIMQREGDAKRYPVRVAISVSTPTMFEKIHTGERGPGAMDSEIQRILAAEVDAEIAKLTR